MKKIQTVFIFIIISLIFLLTTGQVVAISIVVGPRCFVDGVIQDVVHKDAAFGVPAYMGLKQDIPEHYELEILINKTSYVDGESILTCDSLLKIGATNNIPLYKDKIKNNSIPVVQQKIAGIVGQGGFESYSLSGTGLVSLGGISERIKAFFLTIKQFLKF